MGKKGPGITEESQEPRGKEGPSRPLLFSCLVLAVIAGFLALDRFSGLTGQFVLGAATWLVLIASCAPLGADQRAKVALVVLAATSAEILGSVVLGAARRLQRPPQPSPRPPRQRLVAILRGT